MNLLAGKTYDPAVAVTKNTTAALAMTAIDTTNLRLTVVVPAHGILRFRLAAVIHGAATFPSILLGVMNGATVVGRIAPRQTLGTTAVATSLVSVEAEIVVSGLTPGSTSFDAAYGVETLVAATGLKYGGPNDATANNAFGGFVFEIWDPQAQSVGAALSLDANGRVDVGKVLGTAQTAGDLKASMNTLQTDTDDIQTRLPAALVGGRMDSSVGAMAANVLTAAAIAAAALNGKGDWSTYAGGDTAGTTTLLARLTAIRAGLLDNLDAAISSRSTYAGADTAGTTTLLARLTALRAAALDLLDVAVSTRNAVAPDNAGITAIKSKTDSLGFTKPGEVDVNVQSINDTTVVGHGVTATDPWGV